MSGNEKFRPVECLYCESVIRISLDLDADSQVQCPVCGKSFKAKLALASDAPIARTISTGSDTEDTSPSVPNAPRQVPTGRLGGPRKLPSSMSLKKDRPGAKSVAESENGMDVTSEDLDDRPASPLEPEKHSQPSSQGLDDSDASVAKPDGSRDRSRRQRRAGRESRLERDRGWNRIGVDGRTRRKKKALNELEEHDGQQGGIGELALIVIGGLISLPITQLCLWWLVGSDPIQLGPLTSKLIPQVVPKPFHDRSAVAPSVEPERPAAESDDSAVSQSDGSDQPKEADQ